MQRILPLILLTTLSLSLFANKARWIRPISYHFQFSDETERVYDALNDFQKLLDLNKHTFDNQSRLKTVEVHFDSSKTLKFEYQSGKLDSIILIIDTAYLVIPKPQLQTFGSIHFSSLVLMWSNSSMEPKRVFYEIILNHGHGGFFDEFVLSKVLFHDGLFSNVVSTTPNHKKFWYTVDLD